jgi:hypothetical protein
VKRTEKLQYIRIGRGERINVHNATECRAAPRAESSADHARKNAPSATGHGEAQYHETAATITAMTRAEDGRGHSMVTRHSEGVTDDPVTP